jgi:Kef-type K+ transport system membrane component KefB
MDMSFIGAITPIIAGSTFYQFAAILFMAAGAGFLASLLRQPLIVAFIAVGVVAGPSVLGIVAEGGEITLLAKLGIAILLFIVGLKLDVKLIRNLGAVAVVIGVVQMALTIAGGMALSLLFGFDPQTAMMIGIAFAFSSTIIIVKMLSDKKEIDSMHGRIALGVLIIQDLAVVMAMVVMATIGSASAEATQTSLPAELLRVAGYTFLLLVFVGLFMRFAALRLVDRVAHTPELLLCFSIAWAVALAAVCDYIGLSKELGGLVAGVALASTPYRDAIISRLAPLRDFLLLFFFIALGVQLDLNGLGGQIVPALVMAGFVLVAKPLIIMSVAGMLGYAKRTSFLAGLSLAQISEFSLIFISMAFALGMVDQDVLGLVTLVGLITIGISTYLISMSHSLYRFAEPYLTVFERKSATREATENALNKKTKYDIVLFGLGRYGRLMAHGFLERGYSVLAVDFNPEEIKRWRAQGYDGVYGDACDPEFFHSLPLKSAQWVVSALPQHDFGITHEDPRLIIIEGLKAEKFKGKVGMACHREASIEKFKKAGANLVFLPFHDAADRAVNMVFESDGNAKKKA